MKQCDKVELWGRQKAVQEVVDLDAAQIEPLPQMGTRLRSEFIKGMGKHGNGFIIVLDIDRVFSSDELSSAQTITSEFA